MNNSAKRFSKVYNWYWEGWIPEREEKMDKLELGSKWCRKSKSDILSIVTLAEMSDGSFRYQMSNSIWYTKEEIEEEFIQSKAMVSKHVYRDEPDSCCRGWCPFMAVNRQLCPMIREQENDK
jgi:hypothetical protein